LNKLGYVSKPKLCMCLSENADVCTMRKDRACQPALINMEYEVLSEEELSSLNDLEQLKSSVKRISKEMEGVTSGFDMALKNLERFGK